jgi:hypothetical protein
MAPTTEQASALKEMMDARLLAQGHAPRGNFGCEERIMTVDEALEIFKALKLVQKQS